MGSAWTVVKLVGTGTVWHGGSASSLLTEATLAGPHNPNFLT